MEAIKAAIAKHGNVWSLQVNTNMVELYEPLHAARAPLFQDTVQVKKGLKYGDNARHRLDVYTPVKPADEPLPVVVFFHGGGFTSGDTDITPSMHGNIGNYFSSNGCICFLGTYVVLPEARYPSGGQDITAALKYVQTHAASYGGDPSKITVVGQSSGGAHVANAVFSGLLAQAGVTLKGIVLLSPPLSYDLRQERRRKNMLLYHSTELEAEVMDKTGVAVFRQAEAKDLADMNMLLAVGEFDSNEIVDGNLALVEEYRKKMVRMPIFEVLRGHNHISYTLAIGLPGDALSRRLLAFATE